MFGASLVILNANVITLDERRPRAEAVAVFGDRLVAVGSNSEVRKYVSDGTRVVDAKGKSVVPGLVDCHVHMAGFGSFLQTVDLRDAKSIVEVQQKIREYVAKNPEKPWVLGGRWDHERFIEKRLPNRWDLDAVVKEKPVFLVRVCGHIGVVNGRALELAGITGKTVVDGGKVDLDAGGEPTGVLRENALELVWRVVPKPDLKSMEEFCLRACWEAVRAGLTGVHWVVDSVDEIRVVQKLYFEGKLPLRVYLGVPARLLDALVCLGLLSGFGNSMLKLGFVKVFADGSLGARTAALKEPYFDDPKTSGMLLYTQRSLNRLVLKAHRAGLQLAVHAIGDRAVEAVLKAYEIAFKVFPRENHRHRIEHCSVLNPRLIKRINRLGLIASVQPHFVVSDFWVFQRVGERRGRWVYPFKTLMREGIVVASGSDSPVEPINPLLGIWAAVAKANFAEERLSLDEALRTYTLNAAYASFEENLKGSIEVGKLADLVVLSEDLDRIPPEKIRDVSVEMVIIGGKVVYERGKCALNC
ncbi:MAG: amidohydrolase [Candidatus Bathyarchaeia archaeon]